MQSRPRTLRAALAVGSLVGAALVERPASAQIKEPGAHPKYFVELEPHFVLQWSETVWGTGNGVGAGGRVSIPVIANGPVSTINNNLAIGFGFDWVHDGNNCGLYYGIRDVPAGFDCSATHLWFPIVAQWNFFFTPVVSAFGELGLAIQHASFDVTCNDHGLAACNVHDSFTHVRPMFTVGPRFLLTDAFALTLRIGYPYLTLGASFLL